eukprot:217558_1
MVEEMKMTVDVSLCGSIPRSEMRSSSCQVRVDESTRSETDQIIVMAASSLTRKVSEDNMILSSKRIELPSWAVPAKGESFLEPVGDSRYLHSPVDLTKQAVVSVGRSDISDLQLLHSASSRRHAVIFHHPNGQCYIVDCGSAHGTFVNGVRVSSEAAKGAKPYRIRKGSLVRFGGTGSPEFILKMFSVSLRSLLHNFQNRQTVPSVTKTVKDEPPLSWNELNSDCSNCSTSVLVALNTRLNATQTTIPFERIFSTTADKLIYNEHPPAALQLRKRTFASCDDGGTHRTITKKVKVLKSNERDSIVLASRSALVSPSRGKSVFQFDFSSFDRPVVSPNPFEDSPKTVQPNVSTSVLSVPLTLSLPSSYPKKKRVKFSELAPHT